MKQRYSLQLGSVVLGLIALINAAWFLPSPAHRLSGETNVPAVRTPPPAWILGPMHAWWAPEAPSAPFINKILDEYSDHHIPLTVFHFDAWAWETCNNNAQLRFDDSLIQRMRKEQTRAIFWIVPLIATQCPEYRDAAAKGYFVRDAQGKTIVTPPGWWQGEGSWIDFDNPAAVAYWHGLLDPLFARTQGVMGGFYVDDVRPDLANDSSYFDAFVLDLQSYTRAHVPDSDIVFKRYGVNTADDTFLSQYAHVSYVNDFPTDFQGLREGIEHVFSTTALIPAPYNEFTAYDRTDPDAETLIRRMHWGAFQAVMENAPALASTFPWDPHYPSNVMQLYQYYATLHWELIPYLHSYDQMSQETGIAILHDVDAAHDSAMLGDEIFVQYVTDYTRTLAVTLPKGEWINYWDEQVYTGPVTIQLPVPLGREPVFIANGAIIPMQVRDSTTVHGTTASAGALTVDVYPTIHSSFRYFDPSGARVRFDAWENGGRVTLCTDWPPSQPVIYRIERRSAAPQRVSSLNGAVAVNAAWGTPLPPLTSELMVDGSSGGWFFDAASRHLYIKQSQPGSWCPNRRLLRIDRFELEGD